MAGVLLITSTKLKREAGDMFAWILVGLISGWLAGKILNGNGYGMMADIGLGLLGGVAGGMIFAILGVQAHNFIGMILMSTAGATALVIATRIIRDEIRTAGCLSPAVILSEAKNPGSFSTPNSAPPTAQ
jgi:uncharacterized membrane protein YeaQ/YmgE (transglycosylase-associated protein family)